MNNIEKYQSVFINIFNVKVNELNESFTFKDVFEWDSITHMSLIADLEDCFDVMFETEEILNFGSYLNGIKILESKGVVFNA